MKKHREFDRDKEISRGLLIIAVINIFIFTLLTVISAFGAGVVFKLFQLFMGRYFYSWMIVFWIFSFCSFYFIFMWFLLLYYRLISKTIGIREGVVDISKDKSKWLKFSYKISIDAIVVNFFFPFVCNFPFLLRVMGA